VVTEVLVSCPSGKRVYVSPAEANYQLIRIRALRRDNPDFMVRSRPPECAVYQCAACHHFHLTSANRRRRRRGDYGYKHR
jgi:hypothetical protein